MDYNATTPIDPEVYDEMLPYMSGIFGNPSSIHTFGREGKAALDIAREKVADLIGARDSEVYFTSGGSESNNFAIQGIANQFSGKGMHLITTKAEHSSVLETYQYLGKHGYNISYLSIDRNGLIDLDQLRDCISDQTIMASIIYANNETGVVNPIHQICEITGEKGIILHIDAVQAAGKIDINLSEMPIDLMSISSHKIYGPKGAGALFIRKGTDITPLMHGGGQERGKRSGTENVAAITGFGKAAELIKRDLIKEQEYMAILRDKLQYEILSKIDGVTINGNITNRLSNTLNISIDGVEGESLVMNLDLEGIAASTGSACSEGNVDASHVLLAMGLTQKQALSSLRFSFGRFSSEEDVRIVSKVLPEVVSRIRNINNAENNTNIRISNVYDK